MHINPKNKISVLIILTCVLLSLFVVICFAHSGGTDSDGGHYNSSTGEYHYHHGEPAHQHNNGECPYDSEIWWYIILILSPIVLFLVVFVIGWISDSLPHNIILNLENNLQDYHNAILHTNSCYKQLIELRARATIPEGYEIGKDGLPKEIDSSNWGESLTVYTVLDGWKLHLQESCSEYLYKRHMYRFYGKRHSFCQKCAQNVQMFDFEWFKAYLELPYRESKYEKAKDEQQILLNKLHDSYKNCNTKTAKFFLWFRLSKRKKLQELKDRYHQIIRLMPKN